MVRTCLLSVLCGLALGCGLTREIDRLGLRSADDCRKWPHGGLETSGYLILANGLKDDRLRTVRIEAMTGQGLECALNLDGDGAHHVELPIGVYYLRVTWRHEDHESARHWFQIHENQPTLVNAYPEGYEPNPRYDEDW